MNAINPNFLPHTVRTMARASQVWLHFSRCLSSNATSPPVEEFIKKNNLRFDNEHAIMYVYMSMHYIKDIENLFPIYFERGLDINATFLGNSLLCGAVTEGRILAAKYLIEQNINVDHQNSDGNTALHIAILEKKPRAVTLLLNSNANLDIKNKRGKTVGKQAETEKWNWAIQVISQRKVQP